MASVGAVVPVVAAIVVVDAFLDMISVVDALTFELLCTSCCWQPLASISWHSCGAATLVCGFVDLSYENNSSTVAGVCA